MLNAIQESRLNGAFLKAYRQDARMAQNGYCKYCFEPLTYRSATAEHRTPKSRGGSNGRHNIDAACAACNRLKGSMSELVFRHAIQNPKGRGTGFLMAHARRRIWLATHSACKHIAAMTGGSYNMPKGKRQPQ